jgi:phosphatidylserine/phosphatidylglycerophosphate/cardiolipin synthase-like enzyme
MSAEFEVTGDNDEALFTLKVHRGEGMALLAMNWKNGPPPDDFVGFAIEYKEPRGTKFFPLKNRIGFLLPNGKVSSDSQPMTVAPIQKFRWVHFPRNAELKGQFTYRVTPVFMNDQDELSYGERQRVEIELRRETYPGELNVTFTRGFVSSQAFVDRYAENGSLSGLLPAKADEGLTFSPTHPRAKEALEWMGFEARNAILELLAEAIEDTTAKVDVVAYDLSEPDVVKALQQLAARARVIIDDEGAHGKPESAETQAEHLLVASAGRDNVKRQHMGNLQHNKTIVVDGEKVKAVVCGSTNFSWRGFFVQSNNAIVMRGAKAVELFGAAFESYWQNDDVAGFGLTPSAQLTPLGLADIDVQVGFSPYARKNALLKRIADDIDTGTTSSLFYSLAFLSQTPGPIKDAIKKVSNDEKIFAYGIADKKVGGLVLQKPGGNLAPVNPSALSKDVPEPFKKEPTGGGGIRMHHKFVVIDFDKPTARVYLGSYNFSSAADTKNGENLVLIKDRRVAVAYMVEALRIFDHHHFRVAQNEAKQKKDKLALDKPPRAPGEKAWWDRHYTDPQKVRDRELFA